MSAYGIGPNSASSNSTWCPASISGPPTDSRPSGGNCSRGIRLPIEGCGGLMSRMRISDFTESSFWQHCKHDRHRPASFAERRPQQLQSPIVSGEMPAATKIPAESIERDALAGDGTAIEVECRFQSQRRVTQESCEAIQRKICFLGGAEHDQPVLVFADKTSIR